MAQKTSGGVRSSSGFKTDNATGRRTRSEQKTSVNRPVSAGDHRGDRRDMSPTYTGNAKHKARGNTPRKDVKTRKR